MQQHILIVITDGVFQGASLTNDKGDPLPIDDISALQAIIPDLNLALIAGSDAAVATVAAERDALADKLRDIELKLDDPDASKDDVKAEKEKTAKQRQRQALRDELDKINVSKVEVQAKLDALDAKAGGAGK